VVDGWEEGLDPKVDYSLAEVRRREADFDLSREGELETSLSLPSKTELLRANTRNFWLAYTRLFLFFFKLIWNPFFLQKNGSPGL
jgi:hypothetical protein